MSSREDILGRIRARLGRSERNRADANARLRAWLDARQAGPRPALPGDLVQRFRENSEKMSSTVEAVDAMTGVPDAAARYLAANRLLPAAVCSPELAELDWAAAGLGVEFRAARDEDLVGISGCFCAIAETGTLMLCSSACAPASVSLLPETHIAVVCCGRIVPGMEEAWRMARAEFGDLPRAVNFVSGPSRTGDIEQTIVLGAHEPYRVHLILVTGR